MILRFNPALTEQEIWANGRELASVMGRDKDEQGNRVHDWPKHEKVHVATLKNPVLVTDNYRIGQLESTLRDTVFALFASPVRTTEYDGTSLEFEQKKYVGVWGPSIDTLLFCRGLRKADLKGVKKALEVGSGSGFISKWLLEHAPDLESMTLVDFNRYAMECAADNIRDKRARLHAGDALEFIEGKKYDLIVCNPPYIPRPKSIDDNAYEGIGLLRYLIEEGTKQHLTQQGRLITNISSLCQRLTDGFTKRAAVDVAQLDQMEVPLKIYNVLNNQEWMSYLLQRGLKKQFKEGYDCWQTIQIVEMHR
jgi:protein-L-isoaspartate O-methyltransferase